MASPPPIRRNSSAADKIASNGTGGETDVQALIEQIVAEKEKEGDQLPQRLSREAVNAKDIPSPTNTSKSKKAAKGTSKNKEARTKGHKKTRSFTISKPDYSSFRSVGDQNMSPLERAKLFGSMPQLAPPNSAPARPADLSSSEGGMKKVEKWIARMKLNRKSRNKQKTKGNAVDGVLQSAGASVGKGRHPTSSSGPDSKPPSSTALNSSGGFSGSMNNNGKDDGGNSTWKKAESRIAGDEGMSTGSGSEDEVEGVEPGDVVIAVAIYDFEAEHEYELGFKEGEYIRITERPDGEWWTGEIEGRCGYFPYTFVKVMSEGTKKSQSSRVIRKATSLGAIEEEVERKGLSKAEPPSTTDTNEQQQQQPEPEPQQHQQPQQEELGINHDIEGTGTHTNEGCQDTGQTNEAEEQQSAVADQRVINQSTTSATTTTTTSTMQDRQMEESLQLSQEGEGQPEKKHLESQQQPTEAVQQQPQSNQDQEPTQKKSVAETHAGSTGTMGRGRGRTVRTLSRLDKARKRAQLSTSAGAGSGMLLEINRDSGSAIEGGGGGGDGASDKGSQESIEGTSPPSNDSSTAPALIRASSLSLRTRAGSSNRRIRTPAPLTGGTPRRCTGPATVPAFKSEGSLLDDLKQGEDSGGLYGSFTPPKGKGAELFSGALEFSPPSEPAPAPPQEIDGVYSSPAQPRRPSPASPRVNRLTLSSSPPQSQSPPAPIQQTPPQASSVSTHVPTQQSSPQPVPLQSTIQQRQHQQTPTQSQPQAISQQKANVTPPKGAKVAELINTLNSINNNSGAGTLRRTAGALPATGAHPTNNSKHTDETKKVDLLSRRVTAPVRETRTLSYEELKKHPPSVDCTKLEV